MANPYVIIPSPQPTVGQAQYIGDKLFWTGTAFKAASHATLADPATWLTANTVIDAVPKTMYAFDTTGGALTFDPTAAGVSCNFYIAKKAANANKLTLKINGATVAGFRVATTAAVNTDYDLLGSATNTDAAAKLWLVFVDLPNKYIYVVNSA